MPPPGYADLAVLELAETPMPKTAVEPLDGQQVIPQHPVSHVEIHRVARGSPEKEVDADPVGFRAALVADVGAIERLGDAAGRQS